MAEKPSIVLLLAGSLNPPTNGHLLMLEHAKNEINNYFNVKCGVLSPVNDEYDKPNLAHSKHRIEMCWLATGSSQWIIHDSWEANLSKDEMQKLRQEFQCDPSFKGAPTVSIIRHIRGKYGVPVGFVCGADLFLGFENINWWKDNEIELMVGDYMFVLERDDCTEAVMRESMKQRKVFEKLQDRIIFIKPSVRNDVSSSAVRKLLKEGKSIRYLVPDSIVDYVEKEKLYV